METNETKVKEEEIPPPELTTEEDAQTFRNLHKSKLLVMIYLSPLDHFKI